MRVPTTGPYRRVCLSNGEWSRHDVAVAVSHRQRRRGIGAPEVEAVLIRTGSVTTLATAVPIRLAFIDRDGVVVRNEIVPTRRFRMSRVAVWALEGPRGDAGPAVGTTVAVVACRPWPAS